MPGTHVDTAEPSEHFPHLILPWNVPVRFPAHDLIGEWVRIAGVFDAAVTEAILRLIDRGEAAVDVGAHVGHMTSAMARACGRSGRVTAFEPCLQNYRVLSQNALSWRGEPGLAPVIAVHSAVSSRYGVATLCIPSDFEGNTGTPHLLGAESAEPANSEAVPCTTLDAYFHGVSEPALIKIDVEGREFDVLLGAGTLLKPGAVRDVIFEEYAAYPAETHAFLESRGYRIFRISGTRNGPELLPPGVDAPASAWDMPNYLATLDAPRATSRFRASGWRCHGQVG